MRGMRHKITKYQVRTVNRAVMQPLSVTRVDLASLRRMQTINENEFSLHVKILPITPPVSLKTNNDVL